MLNRLTSFVIVAVALTLLLWTLGLIEPLSLVLIGSAVAATEVFMALSAIHRQRSGRGRVVSADDTPLSAVVHGLKHVIILTVSSAVFLAFAFLGGLWHPHWETWFQGNVPSHATPLTGTKDASKVLAHETDNKTTGVIQTSEWHEPFQYLTITFCDEEGQFIEGLGKDDISLILNQSPLELTDVLSVIWHRPTYWLILRDASNSVLGPPFPSFIERSSGLLVQKAFAAGFPVAFRVVDFSDTTHEVSPWTRTEKDVRTMFTASAAAASQSSVFNSLVEGLKDVSNCKGDRRITLISDLGENVGSAYSLAGLAAKATSAGVVLDVIAVPTEEFTSEKQRDAATLVEKTGGRVINAASSTLDEDIAKLVRSAKRPIPAYQVIFRGDGKTDKLKVSATLSAPKVPRLASARQDEETL